MYAPSRAATAGKSSYGFCPSFCLRRRPLKTSLISARLRFKLAAARASTRNRQSGSSGFFERGARPSLASAQACCAADARRRIGSRLASRLDERAGSNAAQRELAGWLLFPGVPSRPATPTRLDPADARDDGRIAISETKTRELLFPRPDDLPRDRETGSVATHRPPLAAHLSSTGRCLMG
jgi:hypothetical protein